MTEKIVQIQLSPGNGEETTDMLYALTDQGRVFVGEWAPLDEDPDGVDVVFHWDNVPLPALPAAPDGESAFREGSSE